jgi:hypothetical protein
MEGRERGHCTLENVRARRTLYDGACTITQKVNGASTLFTIKMVDAQSFMFGTSDGRLWMHGPDEVSFEDMGRSGVFRWADFRLQVDDDRGGRPSPYVGERGQDGFRMEGRERGHCTLDNVRARRTLYDGACTISQKVNGASTIYTVTVAGAQSFLFATSDGGRTWMHGPDEVDFEDMGRSGVFRWAEFRLQVDD